MHIRDIFESTHNDGYVTRGDSNYYLTYEAALKASEERHGRHSDNPFTWRGVVDEKSGEVYLLKQATPISLGDLTYSRSPENDRRIKRGDDFAGDGWKHNVTGEISWTVVGHDANLKQKLS